MMEYLTSKEIEKIASEPKWPALAEKVLELQTSDKFRLAAALLDKGQVALAETIATRACQEIQLAQLFGGVRADTP